MAKPTTYYRPKTMTEAIALTHQSGAITLAGGALTLNNLLLPYDTVIDVQDVPELRRVEQSDQGVTFGASVALQTVLESPSLPQAFQGALTRALPLNLRDGISVSESLRAWKTPMLREWVAALLAHDIGIEYVNADAERSWDNMISLMVDNRLDQDFITAINVPALREGEALGAAYVARTPADAPIVCAAAFVTVDANRRVGSEFVFVSGATEYPFAQVRLKSLIDQPLDEANIASAVKAVAPQVDPVGDYLGSAEYRREMAHVVVQRALIECMEQFS